MKKFIVNPTQVLDHQSHPVHSVVSPRKFVVSEGVRRTQIKLLLGLFMQIWMQGRTKCIQNMAGTNYLLPKSCAFMLPNKCFEREEKKASLKCRNKNCTKCEELGKEPVAMVPCKTRK